MTDKARWPAGQKDRPPAVEVAGLRKSFGNQPVLRGLDLTVKEGALTAILGPSGSGKTTLLRLLAGFERADAGTISIGGETVEGRGQHQAPEARRVGYVPQEVSLFPHLDVKANVGFGVRRAHRRARVADLLELTGISPLAHRFPHQLSGGQQQRVALARALAPGPSLLLLDEPFSSLDASLRASVRLDVLDILRRAGATAVMVTHDQDEALSMADQVAVLREGLVAQEGPPQEVYDRPVDADLARFVGEANLLPGTLADGHVITAFGPLPLQAPLVGLPEGTPLVVLLRPEQLDFDLVGTALTDNGDGSSVHAVVATCEYHGHDSSIVVTISPGTASPGTAGRGTLMVRCGGDPRVAAGTPVALRASSAVMAWAAEATGPRLVEEPPG